MVKLKFRHSHKRIYLLLSTTQNMYVTRMEEADMGDSPVIYLLVGVMPITPGTSMFQPISPLSYQKLTKQQLRGDLLNVTCFATAVIKSACTHRLNSVALSAFGLEDLGSFACVWCFTHVVREGGLVRNIVCSGE